MCELDSRDERYVSVRTVDAIFFWFGTVEERDVFWSGTVDEKFYCFCTVQERKIGSKRWNKCIMR